MLGQLRRSYQGGKKNPQTSLIIDSGICHKQWLRNVFVVAMHFHPAMTPHCPLGVKHQVFISIHPSIYPSIHSSIHPSIHPPIHLSIHLSINQSLLVTTIANSLGFWQRIWGVMLRSRSTRILYIDHSHFKVFTRVVPLFSIAMRGEFSQRSLKKTAWGRGLLRCVAISCV